MADPPAEGDRPAALAEDEPPVAGQPVVVDAQPRIGDPNASEREFRGRRRDDVARDGDEGTPKLPRLHEPRTGGENDALGGDAPARGADTQPPAARESLDRR